MTDIIICTGTVCNYYNYFLTWYLEIRCFHEGGPPNGLWHICIICPKNISKKQPT